MKKLMILLMCSTLALGASSCKKEWTCTCTTGTDTVSVSLGYLGKVSRADAKKICDAGNSADTKCTVK